MKILDLKPGSDEWVKARGMFFCASEAPIMMGESPNVTRNELISMKALGHEKEYSEWVLNVLFQRGHDIESQTKPIAEEIIGQELYPVVCVDSGYLASMDGLTIDQEIGWECKQWNEDKAAQTVIKQLPACDAWQVYHQLLVTGAAKILYMVTDGTPEKTVWMWVYPDAKKENRLIDSWKQCSEDVENYEHKEPELIPVGRTPETLPALRIEVSGHVTASNLDSFKVHALEVIDDINTELNTDQDFANAEKAVKWLRDVEARINSAIDGALSQTASIDAMLKTLSSIRDDAARAKRLQMEKLIAARKLAIRGKIISEAKTNLGEYVQSFNEGFGQYLLPVPPVDFAAAIKGKRTIDSLRNAADTALAQAKIAASQTAGLIKTNMAIYEQLALDHKFLFLDYGTLMLKDSDALEAIIKMRIAEQKEREARRKEDEDEAKKEAESVATEAIKVDEPSQVAAIPFNPGENETVVVSAKGKAAIESMKAPSFNDMVLVLCRHYNVGETTIIRWLEEGILTKTKEGAVKL